MNSRLRDDLETLSTILEDITDEMASMKQEDLIDVAARLNTASKHIESFDKYAKGVIKEKLHHKEGRLLGTAFAALLKLVPTNRLDQKAFKEERPKIYALYCNEATDERVSFEAR